MDDFSQTIESVPLVALVPVALLFLIGLILWVAGRRALRTVIGLIGIGAGIGAGLALSRHELVASVTIPSWVWALVGAILLAAVGVAMYRLVLAMSIAALIGFLAPVGAWVVAELTEVDFSDQQSVHQSALFAPQPGWWEQWLNGSPEAEPAATEPATGDEGESEGTGDIAAETRAAWRAWLDRAGQIVIDVPRAIWQKSPEPLQWILVATAGVGALLGLVLGAAAPSLSAAVVTAMIGASLLISTLWTFAVKLGAPLDWVPTSSIAWLLWWIVTAIIGLGLQWTFRGKQADKSAS